MEEEKYMSRCIELARKGLYNTAPNPMVGAVIVCDGQIIGEGYHVKYGKEHAEVNAIGAVKDESLLNRSTIYVTLEPCSHQGKTPPCADLILKKRIPRVVIGCQDPSTKVSGRGISKLRQAGCEVIVGVLEKECKSLIQPFVTFHTLHRPYITLKWAESADGFMDINRTDGVPVSLSTPLTSMLVHKKRAESAAIMIGTRTAKLDNPFLTVRNWHGQNPVRVVLDRELSLPSSFHLFDGSVRTLVFTAQTQTSKQNVEYITLNHTIDLLPQIMNELYHRNLQSLFVEGGSQLLQSLINAGLWDEIFIEKCTPILHAGVKAPEINNNISYATEHRFGIPIRHYYK